MGRHMKEEIVNWLVVETEEGLFLICGGRRVDDLKKCKKKW